MKRMPVPLIVLIIGILIMIYASVDYFMIDGALNYWLFFIGIIVLFLGIAMVSKTTNNKQD